MILERTSVGLDVHARSMIAAAIDGDTGEVLRARMGMQASEILAWIRQLRLGEVTAVTVPALDQEAARDLVRAREAAAAT